MSKYKLVIELTSDMCVSDGGVYNSSIDTDICYDNYGFPFIPAKRIKGCLRESAQELADWGMEISEDKLFGKAGDAVNAGAVRLGNAYPENIAEMRDEITKADGHIIYHPQNVLRQFSYLRTQTAIDADNGVADPHSLRTMRVAKKGMVFEAELDAPAELMEDITACCKATRHMGIARTRGLGEVKITVSEVSGQIEKATCAPLVSGAVRLDYRLHLKEPVICKSVAGGESVSLDFIEGGKVLGLIAGCLRESHRNYLEFMQKGRLICSNAYIAKGGKRANVIPAAYFKIKNNNEQFIDKLNNEWISAYKADEQINRIKTGFMLENTEGMETLEVIRQERYHHSRPENKGIGRADDKTGTSKFYQISSIQEGQDFCGYITGSEEQMAVIYEILSSKDEIRIGYGRSSEYGLASFEITETSDMKRTETETRHFAAILESDTICYGDNAYASIDYRDLEAEIKACLGVSEGIELKGRYMNYTQTGGYNTTWNMRKPTLPAFGAGTTIEFETEAPVRIPSSECHVPVGERNAEGYGEIRFIDLSTPAKARRNYKVAWEQQAENQELTIKKDSLGEKICISLMDGDIEADAIRLAKNSKGTTGQKATISNLMLLCNEHNEFEKIRRDAENRFDKKSKNKQEKAEIARKIFETVEEQAEKTLETFDRSYHICRDNSDSAELMNEIQMKYLNAYLRELKYHIRGAEKGGNESEK